jgi:NAD(P)-dependent dehydrogenase (short-subunit alcohol dehydrogenase family)
MNRLLGKVAIITGGAGGIGASASALFAREGAHVAVVDIDDEAGSRVVECIQRESGKACFIRADVRDEDSVSEAVAATLALSGRIDVLFNVAGGSAPDDAPVHKVDMALWDRTLSVDLLGTFLFCRHTIPAMIRQHGGTIVNTSSWAALKGFRKHVYVAAKGGILSLTASIAGEYAENGIRANVICPGGVRSKRNLLRYGIHGSVSDGVAAERERIARKYPFSYGDPIDIANIALFLASDESRMITGATIAADGGRSAY